MSRSAAILNHESSKKEDKPKLKGEGDKEVPTAKKGESAKSEEKKGAMKAGSADHHKTTHERHMAEMKEVHGAHEDERRDLHSAHREAHRKMHGRHEEAMAAMHAKHHKEREEMGMMESGAAGGGEPEEE